MNEPRTFRKHYVKKLRACESHFNNNYLTLIKPFTVNNNYLPLIKTLTVNKIH